MEASRSPGERIAALIAAFRQRLAADAARLRELLAEIDSGDPARRAPAIEEIGRLAHKLHGTAPAFSADDVGACARAVETAAAAANVNFGECAPALHARIAELLSLLDSIRAAGAKRVFALRM